ncbi:MAG TPA: hypothetical protein VIV60_11285 [Polyangiaceae bacterium]
MKCASQVGERFCVGLVYASAAAFFAAGCARPIADSRTAKPAVIVDGDAEPPACEKVRANGETPLIDDFELREGQILDNERRNGWWFDYNDGTGGKLLRSEVEVAEGEGQGRALHVTSSGFTKWGSGFGFNLHSANIGSIACAYDASAYTGVRIRARGRGRVRMSLGDVANTLPRYGGTCARPGDSCYDQGGFWLHLEERWKTFEVPFCAFISEGWRGHVEGIDPSTLLALQFRIGERQDTEIWLDDLAFYRAAANAPAQHCGLPCPLDAVPNPAIVEPTRTNAPLTRELNLYAFEQATKACGSITRRYLSYVPSQLAQRSSAPVLFVLHGKGVNAESMRSYLTLDRFEALAKRDGVIVIYGNAAPGVHTSSDPRMMNSGAWRQGYFDDDQVDDVDYLERVLDDMKTRGVIEGNNALFLTGTSNGGGMVLEAARRLANRISGVAAMMPYDGEYPRPVPDLSHSPLKRVLIAYAINDPGMLPGYHNTLAPLPAQWAKAMGLPEAAIATPTKTPLPDLIKEGENYRGNAAVPLATRDSHVTQFDMLAPTATGRVRVLILDHAGHLWPNPTQLTDDWVLDTWGFRNQDFDAADMAWDFMRIAEAAKSK